MPPTWLRGTPKSSTFHTQQAPAVPVGRSRCLDWQALCREGQLRSRGAFLGAALPEGHRRIEGREDQGPGSLVFNILKKFLNL